MISGARRASAATMTISMFAAAGLLALPAGAPAASLPGLLTGLGGAHPFKVRPAVVNFTGDGSALMGGFDGGRPGNAFGHVGWSSWKATAAVGSGAVWIDNCEPSCAMGTFTAHAAGARAFRPRGGHFTRLTLRFDYGGDAVTEELGIRAVRAPDAPASSESYEYFDVHRSSSPLPPSEA